MKKVTVRLQGIAFYLPESIQGDEELVKRYPELPDENIGISERRIFVELQTAGDRAYESASNFFQKIKSLHKILTSLFSVQRQQITCCLIRLVCCKVGRLLCVKLAPSTLALAGCYILTPVFFHEIKTIPRGVGGEIQLTYGIVQLFRKQKVFIYIYEGIRYDFCNKLGIFIAIVGLWVKHYQFAEWLHARD